LTIDADAVGELVRRGTDLDDAAVRQRLRQIGPHSPATLIYTSGTTGRPKGAVLTHGNLAAEVHAVVSVADGLLGPGRKTVLFLPLAHVFARVISVGAVEAGATVVHSSDWSTLPQQFATHRPDFVLAVPRVFEKVFTTAEQTARDAGRGHVFDRAVSTAIAWSRARDTGRAGLQLRLEHKLFDRLVYARIRSALGGRCTQAVSGGGPLGARLSEFFRGAGITVYEGYGLTETSAAVTLNTPGSIRVGSVGRPIPGQSVRVAADGELLLRGPVVFGGRWNNPQATAEAFEDGWFRSGDLGEIDADGFVTVTGRKKEIIVTAAGKNVSPAQLEDVLRADPLVNQAMVVGDGRPFIGALITLDAAALPGWKQRHGVAADTPLTQLTAHPTLLAEIEAVVARANATVSNAERIKRIRVLDADWTQESGELTPKLSLKRAVVAAKFAAEIEALYR
ncbi:long-chain fatty acid--CoA ligase, partial [Nocardia sp. NPDC050789]